MLSVLQTTENKLYFILFYLYRLLLAWFNFPAWINNHIHYDVSDKWNELLVHAAIEVKPC